MNEDVSIPKLLRYVLQTPDAPSVLLWGEPGIGKSEMTRQVAQRLGFEVIVIIASTHDSVDFGGYPMPCEDGLDFLAPTWARRICANEGQRFVVFLDEINHTSPQTLAAMMRLVHERVIASVQLPPARVRIVAAANPSGEFSGGWDLTLPMAPRPAPLVVPPPSIPDWAKWLLGGDVEEAPPSPLDPVVWEAEWTRAKGLVASFLHARPSLHLEPIETVGARFPPSFATPRSWFAASRLIATAHACRDAEAVMPLVEAAVGEPIAAEFAGWLRDADLPAPETVLADPDQFSPDPNRPDRTFAILMSVVTTAIQRCAPEEQADRWARAWAVVAVVIERCGEDMAYLAAEVLAKHTPKHRSLTPRVTKILDRLWRHLREAGIPTHGSAAR